jgi:ubiquinone/menaquinone biosynthesis C-methylase UbiE
MNTSVERNPQAAQMADESMLRTLRFQIEAIWPQESRLFARYALPVDARILDVGCGTGEATLRLAAMFPGAEEVCGVDVMPELLAVARRQPPPAAGRMPVFEEGDGYALRFEEARFDLVVCRHVTQLLPEPERLLAELRRVLKPGGWLHVLSEDYGMLHFPTRNGVDPDRLWHEAVVPFTRSTGTDARIGRATLPILRALGFTHTSLQYLTIDTERVPREYLTGIFTAWRDGYVEPLAAAGRLSPTEVRAMFDAIIDTVSDPQAYGVWHVPVVAGRCP